MVDKPNRRTSVQSQWGRTPDGLALIVTALLSPALAPGLTSKEEALMRRIATISTLVIALMLTGCALVPGLGSDPRTEAKPVATVTCPETYDTGYAEGGLVPEGFGAIAVLRCDPFASQSDAEGTWSGAVLERLEGDLASTLAALAKPSDAYSLGPCPAIGYMLPELWIEGTGGMVIRVAIPTDGCGAPKEVGLDAALAELSVAEETFTPLFLTESSSAAAAGCDTQAGLLILSGMDAPERQETSEPESTPLADESLIPFEMPEWPDTSAIAGARLCDYTTSSPSQDGSTSGVDGTVFSGARELGAAEARELTAVARQAQPAHSCSGDATQVVVIHLSHPGGETAFTVELDGCARLIDPGLRAHAAPAEVLSLLGNTS